MAFLSVRLAAQSASSTGLRMLALTSLDQQVGSVARFSALATPHQNPYALRNQILSGVGPVSNQHVREELFVTKELCGRIRANEC